MPKKGSVAATQEAFVFPLPVVGWEQVLHALDPVRNATRSWARSLRERGLLSAGVTVTRRDAHGLQGRGTYNSVLWVWAERLRVAGWNHDAAVLQEAARSVEERFAKPLSVYLATHSLPELPEAPFFLDMTSRTAKALVGLPHFTDMVVTAGRVGRLDADFGQVTGAAPSGQPTVVDLPAGLLTASDFRPGSYLWVVRRLLGTSALVEIDLAVAVHLPPSVGSHLGWARVPYLSFAVPDLERTLIAGEPEAVAAARYDLTVAAMPPKNHWRSLYDDARAGRLPVRYLRPAG